MTKEIVLAILSHAPHQEAFLPGIGRLSVLQKRNVGYWIRVAFIYVRVPCIRSGFDLARIPGIGSYKFQYCL